MNISLDAVKSYCRVDGEEEDALLLSLVDAAKDYLEGAGVMEPEAEEPLYLLAVKALVLHVVKGLIECIQMIRACVAADMRCHVQQLNVHLQRRVAQQTQKLRLGLDLCRHQIKYRNL